MGSTVLITGANGSLAQPAIRYILEAYPSFRLVLAVRDDSGEDSNTVELRRIVAQHPDAEVSIRKLNLASLNNVREFGVALISEIEGNSLPPLSAIICNAMTWSLSGGPKYSKDGYEMSTAVNHLAHFSLCLRLLRAMDPIKGRIVFVGSVMHWPEKAALSRGYPTQVPADLELLVHPQPDKEDEEMGRGAQRYGTSKLVSLMVMYELGRRLKTVSLQSSYKVMCSPEQQNKDTESIRAITVDPLDLINSRAWSQLHIPRKLQIMTTVVTWLLPLLKFLGVAPRLVTVEQAAKPVVEVSVSDRFSGQEGYFEGEQKLDSSPDSMDVEMQKALWRRSVEWCGLQREDTVIEL
jgi:NAD(P)-dependent dehydrogenase (short-subunit alcohol dehydrogenase family)